MTKYVTSYNIPSQSRSARQLPVGEPWMQEAFHISVTTLLKKFRVFPVSG